MRRERPRPLSSAAEQASTADVVTAATPCMAAAIYSSTANQMITGRSTEGLLPASRLELLLLMSLPPGMGPPPPPSMPHAYSIL